MALSVEESHLMETIIRFAIQKSKWRLGEQQFPRNLAPLIEKWKNDYHEFRLDGVALLGFCVVNRKNVEVLLKEVKEASEKITLNLRLLFSRQELCTEIGELPNCDVTKIAKFTAEKDKITIADAHGDFWRLQTEEGDFDDLEPLDESLYQEICDEQVEPHYPELSIDTSYIEFNHELPVNNELHSTSHPTSPPTLGILQIDCQHSPEPLEDVETAPHSVLTDGEPDNADLDFYQCSPSPIVSPPLLASQTISPERFGNHELHLKPLLFTTSSLLPSEAVQNSEDRTPLKKSRLLRENPSETKLSQFNAFKLQNFLKRQDAELHEALKTLRLEIQKTSLRPKALKQMTSPVRAYLDGLEPVSSEFRRRRADWDDEEEDVEPMSRDSGIPEDDSSCDDVIDVDEHTDTVIEDVRDDFFDSEDIFFDSGCDFLNSKDSEICFRAPNAPETSPALEEHHDNSPDAIKNALKEAVESANGEPVSLLSTISPSTSRKSAARAFFAVLEMTKTRELAPPTQNEPFGDIFLSKM